MTVRKKNTEPCSLIQYTCKEKKNRRNMHNIDLITRIIKHAEIFEKNCQQNKITLRKKLRKKKSFSIKLHFFFFFTLQ